MKHLLYWKNWSSEIVQQLLAKALEIKKNPKEYKNAIQGKNILLFFEKTSTRTRISFAVGVSQLGGNAIIVDPAQTQLSKSKISYEVQSMASYCDLIMARLKSHQDLIKMSQFSRVPIVNGCCNLYHPCQAFADVLTVQENCSDVKKIKLTFVGVHNNVTNSLIAMAIHFEFQLCLVCPISEKESIDEEQKKIAIQKGLLIETKDLQEGLKDANFVYTDTWLDMEFFLDSSKQSLLEERKKIMLPYQLNNESLKNFNGKIMHDMPIHSGYEISDEIVYNNNSIIFQQSENRLHVQKAILLYFLQKLDYEL